MYLMYLVETFFFLIVFNDFYGEGQISTNGNSTSNLTNPMTSTPVTALCPEGYRRMSPDSDCQPIVDRDLNRTKEIQGQEKPSASRGRRLLFIFLGCFLTVCIVFALIITYNHVAQQYQRHPSSNAPTNPTARDRLRNLLQSISWTNLRKNARFNFFSVSSNTYASGNNRQGETSRAHLNENQDEALLFDDPYADGGVAGGMQGTSANPYKSLTLSVT